MNESSRVVPTEAVRSRAEIERTLLAVARRLTEELRAGAPPREHLSLDTQLERELGLDSLARVELLLRVERAFKIKLPEQVLGSAETLGDLLTAVLAADHGPRVAQLPEVDLISGEATVALPARATTLPEVLEWHVQAHPERTHVVFEDSDGAAHPMTYAGLWQKAQAVAAALSERGVYPGQAVSIMLPTGLNYYYSFFGALLIGAIPVPIYPPARLSQIEEHFRRHAGILSNAQAVLLVTMPEAKALARLLMAQVETLKQIVSPDELLGSDRRVPLHSAKSEDIAFLQYTSGSTGNPKGVMLTHANLLANLRAMGPAARVSSSDVFISWLPLYHDMGLVGWLAALYYAFPTVVMSPLSFLARPEHWLWAIHRHRGTVSGGPNFAYELCLRKIEDQDIVGLDLSSWRWAFNGAEPVSPETMRAFVQRFGRYGFRPDAVAPVYGLAENTVGVAFPPAGQGLRVDRVKRDVFTRTRRAEPAPEEDATALRFVACGRPLPGHEIRVVDVAGRELGERQEGRLEFKGPSATRGYYRRPDETAKLYHGDWLDSGDLAYIAGGDLYLTGRVKDIIIRGGRNIYPHELEEAVGNIAGVRRGCVAVFGSRDPVSATERLVVLAETRESDPAARARLREEINAAAMELLGAPADEIVLAPVHTVLKTSSGKIRHAATRERFEQGLQHIAPRAVWWQILRLAAADAWPALRRTWNAVIERLYAAYAWILFALLAPLAWVIAAVLPYPGWAWKASGLVARAFFRLAGAPIRVDGLENLPGAGASVLVANHSSYLDGLVLVAALATPFSFVAKRELGEQFFAGTFLRHIGTEFVERFDPERSVEAAERLVELARAGRSLAFFPEGTFTRAPGLRPFRLGAFVAAVEGALPVVPVTLTGTRYLLRGDEWFPRRGKIGVIVGRPIAPDGSDWAAAIKLRDAVRGEILRHCGEPDLVSG
jgi:1-acyl-sn-glycerol-3-phosphate acyltransferase